MEITRKRVNRGVHSYLLKIGGYVIRHPNFDDRHPALFKKDGVYLSFIANDIFLNQIQGALETFLKCPHCLVYPFNWDNQMLKWMLCIVVPFVKDVYSISWSQFEIWIIRLFTMLIVMFFWSLSCNFDKSKVCWIWQFIKFWIFTLDFLSMLFANDAEVCLICHGVNLFSDLQFTVVEL
jgi:hypothetical protein